MAANPGDYVYRKQRRRFPWWVKSVDKITTEVDESILEKPTGHVVRWMAKNEMETMFNLAIEGREKYSQRVQNDEPGTRLQDVALHQGAASLWGVALVGRLGFEPRTLGLKVRCSDQAELPARGRTDW